MAANSYNKKYKVAFISKTNGNLCEGMFRSTHRRGSKANLADAIAALTNRFGEDAFEVQSIRAMVPYEPDGIIL